MKMTKSFTVSLLLFFLVLAGCKAALKSTSEFTSFSFLAATNSALSSDVAATISGTNITASVPYGTSRSSLVASFTHNGKSVTHGGVAQVSGVTANDFSFLPFYTVTAEDDSSTFYSVAVEESAPTISTIGSPSGGQDIVVIGYDVSGNKESTVTISPYTKGFKIKFTPVAVGAFICNLSDSLIQAGNQKTIEVAGSISDLPSSLYNGYVESGSSSTCTTFKVETVWVVLSDAAGFDPSKPYTVDLDDVDDASGTNQVINVVP